jgi:hypothetical protein
MDELAKQKIPIIIKQHILYTKIEYLVEKLIVEKGKCKPATEKTQENRKEVFVQRITNDRIKNEKTTDTKIITNEGATNFSTGKI